MKLKKTELHKPTGFIVDVITILAVLSIKIIALLIGTGSKNVLAV